MATQLDKNQQIDILTKLKKVAEGVLALQQKQQGGQASTPLPAATPMPLTDAQKYGASGKGEYLTPELSGKIQTATEKGVPMSELGTTTGNKSNPTQTYLDKPSSFKAPTLDEGSARNYVSAFGLTGMVDPKAYTGKTASEVNNMLLQEKQKRFGQISANNTVAFNPEIMQKTQRAVDKFNFALDETSKSPFEPKSYKQDAKGNLIDVTSRELGQLFSSPDQLYNAYQFNPQLKATLDKFIAKGGTIEGITKNITAPVSDKSTTVVSDIQNADGTRTVKYADGTSDVVSVTKNADGSESYTPKNVQDPASYLASLNNPQADQKAQTMALNELAPETDVAQAEIMRQAKIPSELKSLYFGDEKSVGLIQMKKDQAVEEMKLLQEREKDAKATARDKAQLTIAQNNAQVKIQESTIEENRLAAKNYMTAKLAQLGALQTTGAAVLSLQTLETKYQTQVATLRNNLDFTNRSIELNLNEKINDIENDTTEKINKIQEDVNTDSATMAKEVFKAQNDAQKEIYSITKSHATTLRERTTKYTEQLKAEAAKYAKEYAAKAAGGVDFTSVGNVTSKSKIVKTIENALENSRGADTFVNSEVYTKAYKDWITKGGTAKTFVAQFPPKLYANPDDTSLPANLRYARESQTVKNTNNVDAQIEDWMNSQ